MKAIQTFLMLNPVYLIEQYWSIFSLHYNNALISFSNLLPCPLDGCYSNMSYVKSGVPDSTMLGHLFFALL